jgi:hypothetical protein
MQVDRQDGRPASPVRLILDDGRLCGTPAGVLFCLTQPVVSDSIEIVLIRFTQAARKHRVGRSSARYVIARTAPTGMVTEQGSQGWRYVGRDERERELEIIAVELEDTHDGEDVLLVIHVIHVMPTQLRGRNSPHA